MFVLVNVPCAIERMCFLLSSVIDCIHLFRSSRLILLFTFLHFVEFVWLFYQFLREGVKISVVALFIFLLNFVTFVSWFWKCIPGDYWVFNCYKMSLSLVMTPLSWSVFEQILIHLFCLLMLTICTINLFPSNYFYPLCVFIFKVVFCR